MGRTSALWHPFAATVEGEPARFNVDLTAFDPAERRRGAETLLALGITMSEPGTDGCGEAEASRLDELREEIQQALSTSTQLVGSIARGGTFQLFFYTSPVLDGELLPMLEKETLKRGWDKPWIHAEKDPEWTRFTSFLLPSPAERIQALNARSLQAYEQGTHDMATRRSITHALLFPSQPAADLAIQSLQAMDFEPAQASPYGEQVRAKVHRQDPLDHIPALTMMLSEVCAPYDGDHLSWTAV